MDFNNKTKKTDSELFGEHLRFLRTSKTNFSQFQVAKILIIDRSTYTNYELGKIEPDIRTLKALARLFNISIDALLVYESNEYI